MFVVVTLLACWLSYELNWIRQRRAFIAHETAVRYSHRKGKSNVIAFRAKTGSPDAPSGLWLFGEPGYSSVGFVSESHTRTNLKVLTAKDRDRLVIAKRLFPEAVVNVVTVWEDSDGHGAGHWRPD
jgi:hypothetical protein